MNVSKLISTVVLMGAAVLFSTSGVYAQDWYDVNWQYRKAIIIDASQVSANLTDFPLLVDVTDPDLQSKALSNGDDILFTGDDGTTKLDHEIESYDGVTGNLISWVRVPSLASATDTVLYMYYGNPAATDQGNPPGVWDASYVMVQHLNEISGPHQNSTSLSPLNDGTPSVTLQGSNLGKIDGADVFNGTSDNVNCGNDASLDITGSMTVEAWAYSENGLVNSKRIASKDKTGIASKFILWKNGSGDLAFIVADSSLTWYRAQGNPVTDGAWFHVVGVYDDTAGDPRVRLYLNGALVPGADVAGPASLNSPTIETVTIGASDDNDQHWNGRIDEVRISNGKRSAEWIQTSYNNQNDPGSFYLLGSERALGVWWNPKWNYRKVITVDAGQVSGPLTNFPLLVDITDADLASDAQPDGDDIAFTDINGTQLSHEIELYDGDTGQVIAWVKVPSLSSTENTLLFMYFGNSTATNQEDLAGTWDSNFVMVQHLDETSGNHLDSTGNANDGTTVVVSDQGTTGMINGADDFDGIGDYVRVPDAASLQFGEGSFTAEAWIYPESAPDVNGVRIVNNRGIGLAGAYPGWQLKIEDSGGNWVVGRSAIDDAADNYQRYDGTTPYLYNQWYRLVMVYEADNELRFYVNSALDGTLPIGPYGDITNSLPTVIGASLANEGVELASGDQLFDGIIDEVRLSNLARSDDWIVTSYTNQSAPGSFSQTGGLELEPCEGDFDCDGDVDGSDAQDFKGDFGRSQFLNPCESGNSCDGDFTCDGDVDGGDAILFKADFGRSIFLEPCPACVVGEWCTYP